MKKDWLLPRGFKKIGWVMLIPTLLIGVFLVFNGMDTAQLAQMLGRIVAGEGVLSTERIEPWLNNVLIIGIIAGSLFVTCSRERIEDEMIGRIRLNALLLAVYVNFGIVILASLAVYELDFIDVMIYNLFTLPLLFLAVYRYRLWRLGKEVRDEE